MIINYTKKLKVKYDKFRYDRLVLKVARNYYKQTSLDDNFDYTLHVWYRYGGSPLRLYDPPRTSIDSLLLKLTYNFLGASTDDSKLT